jgi:hypothetical protein
LKESNGASEVAREHHPDESEKSAQMLPKSPETKEGRSRAFERIMIGGLFVAANIFIQS